MLVLPVAAVLLLMVEQVIQETQEHRAISELQVQEIQELPEQQEIAALVLVHWALLFPGVLEVMLAQEIREILE